MKKAIALILVVILAAAMSTAVFAEGLDTSNFSEDYQEFQGQGIVINVYNWGEYISDGSDDMLDINAEFEKLTGIEINYTTFATNEELYAKISGGSVDYDVMFPSDYMINKMSNEGLLAELDFDNIPNFEYIYDRFKNPEYDVDNLYSVPYTWGTVGIVYNTTMVDEEVNSWEILFDEKYKDEILMFSNSRDAFAIPEILLGYSLNTTDEAELDAVAAMLKDQKSLVQAYVMDEIYDKMGSGEAALAPYYAGDAMMMMGDNEDLAFVVPDEGTNRFVDAMCILKTSDQKEAAEMYINFLCEPEIAYENISYIEYSTPHSAAYDMLDDETKDNESIYPPAEIMAKTETFRTLPVETDAYISDLWTDVLSSDGGFSTYLIPAIVIIVVLAGAGTLTVLSRKRKKQQKDI